MNRHQRGAILLYLIAGFVLAVNHPASVAQSAVNPAIAFEIKLDNAEYKPGETITGTLDVRVSGLTRSAALGGAAAVALDLLPIAFEDIAPEIMANTGTRDPVLAFFPRRTLLSMTGNGPVALRIEQLFPFTIPEASAPLKFGVALKLFDRDSGFILSSKTVQIEVPLAAPKKEIALVGDVAFEGGQPIPRKQKVRYGFKYKITGLPRKPDQRSDLLERVELYREVKSADGKTSLVKLNAKDQIHHLPGVSGGGMTCERNWWVNVSKPGPHVLRLRFDIGGFPPFIKDIRFTAQGDQAAAPEAPAKPDEYAWVCDGPVDNFKDVSARVPGLYAAGSPTSLTVNEESVKDGKKQTFATTVNWTAPPLVMREGQKITLVLTAPQREGSFVEVGHGASNWRWVKDGSFTSSTGNRYAATNPNATKDSVCTLEYGITTKNSSLGSKATIYFQGNKWQMPAYIVNYPYVLKKAGDVKPEEEAEEAGPGEGELDAEETFNLTAWLESETIELRPGGETRACTVYFKGWRPQGNRVEAVIDTSDSFGSTAVNRAIQVRPGTTSAATSNIIAGSGGEGGFVEMWSVGANAQPGAWQVPILVRQAGVGQVRLLQNVRIMPKRGAAAPPTGPTGPGVPDAASAQGLGARLEYPAITLWPGQVSDVCGVYVRGWDKNGGPVNVSFPQADNGSLPGGVLIFPGNTGAYPYNMFEGMLMGVRGYHRFPEMFRAREDAPPGVSMIDIVVSQEGMGEARLRLQVNVKAPGVAPGPALTAGPVIQPVSNGNSPQGLTASLDAGRLYLRPGGPGAACSVLVKGFRIDVPDEVEVVFPQADRLGAMPSGLRVFPGTSSDSPSNLLGRRSPLTQDSSFQEIYRAGEDASPGFWPVDILVRQRGAGEVRLRLIVAILDKLRPNIQERPGRDILAVAQRANAAGAAVGKPAEKTAAGEKPDPEELKLRKVAEENPKSVPAWKTLADYYVSHKKPDGAVAAYRNAVELDPKDPMLRLFLAHALLEQGNKEEAKAEARKALPQLPPPLRDQIIKEFGLDK